MRIALAITVVVLFSIGFIVMAPNLNDDRERIKNINWGHEYE